MATDIRQATARRSIEISLRPVTGQGPLRGFCNLFSNEARLWWGTRRLFWHLLIWPVLLNMLVFLDKFKSSFAGSSGEFIGVGILATTIGVVSTAQGAIIREKQLGTAAWLMSKPVSRNAFILAKLAAYALGFLTLAIGLPALVFYLQATLLWRFPAAVLPFVAGLSVFAIHLLFYLALTVMLSTLFNERAPVAGIGLALLFGGIILPLLVPKWMTLIFPWMLSDIAIALAAGQALPTQGILAIVIALLWMVVFVGVALWRFGREEF